MTDRIVMHSTSTHERSYRNSPAEVFTTWADPAAKARWFGGESAERHDLDFRVGGLETTRGRDEEGRELTFESRYHDIVTGERIVYSSTLQVDKVTVTVSLTTVQFQPTTTGTAMLLTEQAAYLDGQEQPQWRESGTRSQLAALDRELAPEA